MSETDNRCILFFVKYPVGGEVKSRLAEVVGDDAAAELYKCFVADMQKMLAELDVPIIVFCDPGRSLEEYRQWLGQYYTCIHQVGDGIGERMKNAFDYTFANHHYTKAVLIGSDFPDLPSEYITRGFEALDSEKIAIAPADDGGYYLIGFRNDTFLPDVFDNIIWSGPEVLEQTLGNIAGHRMLDTTTILAEWHDIDTFDDLSEFFQHAGDSELKDSATMRYILENLDINLGDDPSPETDDA